MNKNEADRLLNELFVGDELDAFRRDSLEESLVLIRRRDVRHQRIRRAALLAVVLLPLAVFLHDVMPRKTNRTAKEASVPASKANVEIISDEQLFALFPNRPLALLGKPGQQRLVFLDQVQNPNSSVTR